MNCSALLSCAAVSSRAAQVSEQIKDLLTSKAVEMYIAIDDISITHLVFDEDFTNAIERKQVAQQDVERVKVRAGGDAPPLSYRVA